MASIYNAVMSNFMVIFYTMFLINVDKKNDWTSLVCLIVLCWREGIKIWRKNTRCFNPPKSINFATVSLFVYQLGECWQRGWLTTLFFVFMQPRGPLFVFGQCWQREWLATLAASQLLFVCSSLEIQGCVLFVPKTICLVRFEYFDFSSILRTTGERSDYQR